MEEIKSISPFADNKRKLTTSWLILTVIAVLSGTFLRVGLFAVYPLVALSVLLFFKFRISPALLILIFLLGAGTILSFLNGGYIKYKALSLFYTLPFLFLLFSDRKLSSSNSYELLRILMSSLAIITLLNDLIGFLQVLQRPDSHDSFRGIYSDFSVSLNGLSIINAILAFYYFLHFVYQRRNIYIVPSLFFLFCSVLGFYGAGLIVCIAAFTLALLRIEIKTAFKTLTAALFALLVLYFSMRVINSDALDYTIANLKKIAALDVVNGPRKITSFYNYAISYPDDVKDFLFGSGPGTFNSRSAFIVGSPSYFTGITPLKDEHQPYYFRNFAYPLWNESNTSQQLYLDGFRNQPFSSILAFLGEYGLIFTVAFGLLLFSRYHRAASLFKRNRDDLMAHITFRFFKFLVILLCFLMIIDNYVEYPEIMLIILLAMQFCYLTLWSVNSKKTLG